MEFARSLRTPSVVLLAETGSSSTPFQDLILSVEKLRLNLSISSDLFVATAEIEFKRMAAS